MKLEGQFAIVTGASRGIGAEIARHLAAEGATVALVGRRSEALEETARSLDGNRGRIFTADLRDAPEIAGLSRSVHASFGRVDILVNAAGVWRDEHEKFHGPNLADTPEGQIDEVVDVGLRASMLLSRLVLPGMIENRRGKILQIACGFAGPHEAKGWLHYYVTNKAIEAFTAGLAAEVRSHEIQVNCIAPWFVASEAVVRMFPSEAKTALATGDVAKLAGFLVSRDADHISGQTIELRSKLDQT